MSEITIPRLEDKSLTQLAPPLTEMKRDQIAHNGGDDNRLAEKLRTAKVLTDRGAGLFLLKPKSKEPLESGWQQKATNDFEMFRAHLEANPACNIGVATGRKWNLCVLDIDPRHGGDDSLQRLEGENGPLPETFVVRTGGGGTHHYFTPPIGMEVKNSASTIAGGIDTRGNGGYVVGPGSEHETGGIYEIVSAPLSLAAPPDWLVDRLATQRKAGGGSSLVTFEEGRRNTDLYSLAGTLRRRGLDEQKIDAALQAVNSTTERPLDSAEVSDIARGIGRYEVPTVEDFTERRLADAFARNYENQIARISEGGWAYYENGCWYIDPSGPSALICQEAVKSFMAAIDAEVRRSEGQYDRENADKLISAAKRCQSANVISHVMRLAASDPALMVPLSAFDKNPDLLNLKNGLLDLGTGDLLPHDPKYRLMKQAGVEFDASAKCPVFDRFLEEILEPEVGEFLMRAFAYSLLGRGDKQLAFVLLGSGLNGKTTLENAICGLAGSYTTAVDPNSLLRRDSPSVRSDIARLCGTRIAFTSEFAQGAVIDAPLIKRLTGNETITARFLYKEEFEFSFHGVFFITTNYPPVIDGSDFALARRICVVPFDRQIAKEKIDTELGDKLRGEWSGILNRLLGALREYRDRGLEFPPDVKEATDKFIGESDLVGEFLRECCEGAPGFKVAASTLGEKYAGYCLLRGTKRLSAPTFNRTLESKGYQRRRTGPGYFWEGIRLRSAAACGFGGGASAADHVGNVGSPVTL